VELAEVQQVWDRLGRTDPLWAVLTDARFRGGGWDPAQLFALGVAEVDAVMDLAQQHGLTYGRQAALDFGCGVGRLSQALARYFDSVVGVDIAASMVAQAEEHNRHGAKCRFVVNDRSDLRLFPDATFDFVLSLLVLQHMEPRFALGYLREFLRVLRPGGLLVFQVPSGPEDPSESASIQVALGDDAYAAELSCARPPLAVTAGAEVPVRITARNLSASTWPPSTSRPGATGLGLGVGNHWLRADGTEIRRDDGRKYLAGDVAGGQTVDLELVITAPLDPGRYVVEFDMVHEGVTWFAGRGSNPLKLPVQVRPDRRKRFLFRKAAPEPPPVMEMHILAASEVEDLVSVCGATMSWVQARQVPGYTDSLYFVTRPAGR
jgi:SAM-dependent methyltransferase